LLLDISRSAHEALSLKEVLNAISEQIHQRLALDATEVEIATTQDDIELAGRSQRGDFSTPNLGPIHEVAIRHHQQLLGKVRAAKVGAELSAEQTALLGKVVDVVANALENAISFEVISSYRSALEQKVSTEQGIERGARPHSATLDSRNRFFANVNHELRTPLSVLLLSLDQLSGDSSLSDRAVSRSACCSRTSTGCATW